MEHRSHPGDSGENVSLLAVRVLVERGSLRLVLAGELDLDGVPHLHREVRRALETWPSPAAVKIDLSHLRFIDVAGLRALDVACLFMSQSTGDFTVVGVPLDVLHAIEVSGIQVPGLSAARRPRNEVGQIPTGEAHIAAAGRAKRSRTEVPPRPERNSTKSHS